MARDQERERQKRFIKMMKDLRKIDPTEILVFLPCLSSIRKEQIRARLARDGATIAADELFEELPKREDWYNTLVNALREIGRDDLADKLEGPEKKSPSPSPSGSSCSVATGKTSNKASVSHNHDALPSPPAPNSHPSVSQEKPPEAEASVSPDFSDIAAAKDVTQKGVEKNVNPAELEKNTGQQSPSSVSLPMPVREGRQETLLPVSGGPAVGKPKSDQPSHDGSESDQCNNRPSLNARSRESGGAAASSPSADLLRHGGSGSDQPDNSPTGGTAVSSPSTDLLRHGGSGSDQPNNSPTGGTAVNNPSTDLLRHGRSGSDQPNNSPAGGTAVSNPSTDLLRHSRSGSDQRDNSPTGGAAVSNPSTDLLRHGGSGSDQPNNSPTGGAAVSSPSADLLRYGRSGLDQPDNSPTGGAALSSPKTDLLRHGGAGADQCNNSPSPNAEPTGVYTEDTAAVKLDLPSRESGGAATSSPRSEQACRQAGENGAMPSGYSSSASAAGGLFSKDSSSNGPTERHGANLGMERVGKSGGEKREDGLDKENVNLDISHQTKNPNLQKFKDPEGKINNLSPTTHAQEFSFKKDDERKLEPHNVVDHQDDVYHSESIRPLCSTGNPDERAEIDKISFSQLLISQGSTASPGGSQSQQNDGGQGGVQEAGKGGDRDMVDAATDNQDSLLKQWGTIIWGYVPHALNALGEHMLNQ